MVKSRKEIEYVFKDKVIRIRWQINIYSLAKLYILNGQVYSIYFAKYIQYTFFAQLEGYLWGLVTL